MVLYFAQNLSIYFPSILDATHHVIGCLAAFY